VVCPVGGTSSSSTVNTCPTAALACSGPIVVAARRVTGPSEIPRAGCGVRASRLATPSSATALETSRARGLQRCRRHDDPAWRRGGSSSGSGRRPRRNGPHARLAAAAGSAPCSDANDSADGGPNTAAARGRSCHPAGRADDRVRTRRRSHAPSR
jgi:hypothetical protein